MTQDTMLCQVLYIYQKMFPTQMPYKLMVSQQMDIRNTNGHEIHKDTVRLMSRERQQSQHIKTNHHQGLLSRLHRKESLCGTYLVHFFIFNRKRYSLLILVGASGKAPHIMRVCKKTAGAVNKTTSSHLLILDSLWCLGESLSLKLVTSLINYYWVDTVWICKSKRK